MSTIAIGSSVPLTVAAGGQVTVASNGGFWTATETPSGGNPVVLTFGPSPIRRTFGPYDRGATLSLSNTSANSLVYVDREPMTATTAAITAGGGQTFTLSDGGTLAFSSNGGTFTTATTPAIGDPTSRSHGPGATRFTLGPFQAGATVVVANANSTNLVTTATTAATSPLLFASPNNAVSNNAGTNAAGTQLHTLSRGVHTLAFDCSELRVMVVSFDNSAATITLAANAFTVQGVALEKGDASQTVVGTFGGVQSKVINPGDNEAVSDAFMPSAFALSVFAAGSKWFVREQRSVSAAGLKFPVGAVPYVNAGFPANVGIMMDPVTYLAGGGSTLGGTGAFALGGGGWTSLPSPPKVFLLGRPVGAAPGVWVHIGDSIPAGAGDAPAAGAASVLGLMSRACWTSDGGANNIACLNMGSSGAVGSMWQSANAPLAKRLWAYANRATEEFGTNRFQPIASSDAAERTAALQNWADLRAAGITKIVRTKLLPRTTSTDAWATTGNQTPLNGSWNPAGTHEVYDFNAWLDTQLGVGNGPDTILPFNAARASTTQSVQNFLIWNVGPLTADGIHPNTAMHTALASGEIRPALLAFA